MRDLVLLLLFAVIAVCVTCLPEPSGSCGCVGISKKQTEESSSSHVSQQSASYVANADQPESLTGCGCERSRLQKSRYDRKKSKKCGCFRKRGYGKWGSDSRWQQSQDEQQQALELSAYSTPDQQEQLSEEIENDNSASTEDSSDSSDSSNSSNCSDSSDSSSCEEDSSSSSEEDDSDEDGLCHDKYNRCEQSSTNDSFQRAIRKFKDSLDYGFFKKQTCARVGIQIREYLPKCLLKELEENYLETKCKFLSAFSAYPIDIAPFLQAYPPTDLIFDVLLIGSGPGNLAALKRFADSGKRVLMVEAGQYAPLKAISLYERPSLLVTDYVRKMKARAPFCHYPKTVILPNLLGGITSLNMNQWNVGAKKYYDRLGQISDKWCWEKVKVYYDMIERYREKDKENNLAAKYEPGMVEVVTEKSRTESYAKNESFKQDYRYKEEAVGDTVSVAVEQQNSSYVSVSSSIKETTITKTVFRAFAELGLAQDGALNIASLDNESEGFKMTPVISDGTNNILFAQKMIELVEGKDNVQIAMNTEAIRIEMTADGRAVGVQVQTSNGETRTIGVNDEVILGGNAIKTVQLLGQSGLGDRDALERIGIPVQLDLPNLGKNFKLTPSFFGLCMKFLPGLITDDDDSDPGSAALSYLYGNSKIAPSAALNFYKAYLRINSDEPNVRVSFQVFSKGSNANVENYIRGFFHLHREVEDYIINLVTECDLLFFVPMLRSPSSAGSVNIDVENSTPHNVRVAVDTGLLGNENDMEVMKKSIKKLMEIAKTEVFTGLGGELIKLPAYGCPENDFDCYIRYYTVPGLQSFGGLTIGTSSSDSVVNDELTIHNTQNIRCFSSGILPFTFGGESAAFSVMLGVYGSDMVAQKHKYPILKN